MHLFQNMCRLALPCIRKLGSHIFNSSHLPLTILKQSENELKINTAKLTKEYILQKFKSMETSQEIKATVINKLFKYGIMGVEIPKEYGGKGSNFMATIQVIEEISKIDPALGLLVEVQNTLINSIIMALGTNDQKDEYLPRLATNLVSCLCLTEPKVDESEAFALRTLAVKDGPNYLINGSKMWVANSNIAELFLIMANAKPELGVNGITCFMVDKSSPGLAITESTINLDNVRVPESNILGKFGQGYNYAIKFLDKGRIGIAAQMLGCAQGCFDATIPLTFGNHPFGNIMLSSKSLTNQIAEMATNLEAARLLTYNAVRLVEHGLPYAKEASMAKNFASEIAQQATIKCIDLINSIGFSKDFPLEKIYQDARIGHIYEGNYNIQLASIAKHIENEYRQ